MTQATAIMSAAKKIVSGKMHLVVAILTIIWGENEHMPKLILIYVLTYDYQTKMLKQAEQCVHYYIVYILS